MTRAEKIKRQIDQAIANREARVACLIVDDMRNALNLLDEQPAAVIEAMIEHGTNLLLSGNASNHRYRLQAALIEYLEERLREVRASERQLAQAITGTNDLSDD
jgi:hypothetical protein